MDGCVETYLSCCQPYQLPPPWDIIPADPAAGRGPEDPQAAFRALSERHSPEALIKSGLVVRDDDGRLRLHPALREANVSFVALQFADPRRGSALMLENVCIGADERPFIAAMGDLQTRTRFGPSEDRLLITATLADAILLRSVGLPSAPATGMAELDDTDLEQMETVFGFTCQTGSRADDCQSMNEPLGPKNSSPAPAAANSGNPDPRGATVEIGEASEKSCGLLIVDWSPLTPAVDSPAELVPVIRHLHDLDTYHKFDLMDAERWTPTSDAMGAIRFALDRRVETWARDAILDSLVGGVRAFHQPRAVSSNDVEQPDLPTATERVIEALVSTSTDDASRRKQREAVAAYRRIAVEQVVTPLVREAQAAGDPTERLQRFRLAELSSLFVLKFPGVMSAALTDSPAANGPGRRQDTPLNELLAIDRQIEHLIGELSDCKRHQKTALKKPRSSPRTIEAISWQHLGLPAKS